TDCSRIDGQQKCDNCEPSNQYHCLAQGIVDRQVAKAQQGSSNKRPLQRSSSFEEFDDITVSWDDEGLATMEKIEQSAMKKIKLDHGVAAVASASSSVCSSPAYSPFSSFRTPSLNSASSRAYQYSGSALVKGGKGTLGDAITQAAAANAASDLKKKGKSEMLDQFMPALIKACPVCWILTGKRIPSNPVGPVGQPIQSVHMPFQTCPFNELLVSRPGNRPTFQQFVDFRKSILLRGNFNYCFLCTMPQSKDGNGLEPNCHAMALDKYTRVPSSSPQLKRKCPWANIIQASLFALYFDRSAMAKLLLHFPYSNNPESMTIKEWAEWLNTDLHDQGEYWKGLEVFLFKAAEHGMIHCLQ
ncbi:hypothetical protein M378DRAFT_182719, partial [Amanita muscaria Koide BX008]